SRPIPPGPGRSGAPARRSPMRRARSWNCGNGWRRLSALLERDSARADRPLQELLDPLRVEGAAEQVALAVVAVHGAQALQLALGLDPLGHHLHVEAVRQANHGADDLVLLAFRPHAADERAVDLEDAHGKLLERA